MAQCLISLGANLGDRAAALRQAVDAIGRIDRTHVVARSAWHETPPVGGPAGQGPFLNGAVLAHSTLPPEMLVAALLQIESAAGRVRQRRWDARPLDLDLLLYGDVQLAGDAVVPHPRMHYRQFVLAPAAEVAPWMLHSKARWTVARLAALVQSNRRDVAVAAADQDVGAGLIEALEKKLAGVSHRDARVTAWRADSPRSSLILAAAGATGGGPDAWRKMLELPATGPVAWLTSVDAQSLLDEALAVIASAWPDFAAAGSNDPGAG